MEKRRNCADWQWGNREEEAKCGYCFSGVLYIRRKGLNFGVFVLLDFRELNEDTMLSLEAIR